MAIEEWNAKGGVLNKKLAAVVEDSQCTPDPAVNAANKVIDQDKVKYIVGERIFKAYWPKKLYNHDAEAPNGMKYVGETERKIREIFVKAKEKAAEDAEPVEYGAALMLIE